MLSYKEERELMNVARQYDTAEEFIESLGYEPWMDEYLVDSGYAESLEEVDTWTDTDVAAVDSYLNQIFKRSRELGILGNVEEDMVYM